MSVKLASVLTTNSISSSTFVQSILWKLNKFDKLKELPGLDDYEVTHDPTVAPLAKPSAVENIPLTELPTPRPRPSSNGYYTSADYHSLYKSGQLTPTDVANAILPLIRRDTSPAGPHSVAFLDSKVDLVTRAAEASTARYASGKPLSYLDGVPIAVKDEVDMANYKRMLGSRVDFTNPVNETAWCIKMLEEAGAIVVGKTNMHEMGLGGSFTHTQLMEVFSDSVEMTLILRCSWTPIPLSIHQWRSGPIKVLVLKALSSRHHKQ
jgi:hypothetical protein